MNSFLNLKCIFPESYPKDQFSVSLLARVQAALPKLCHLRFVELFVADIR